MVMLATVLIGLCVVSAAYAAGLRPNLTPSFPRGLYWLDTQAAIQTGDLVLACPVDSAAVQLGVERGYIGRGTCPGGYQPLLKRLVAIEGDVVTVPDGVRVNGSLLRRSEPLASDSRGRPLSAWEGGKLDPGTALLMSDHHAASFDGRYIGPIPTASILGRVQPVWTFGGSDV